MTETRPGQLHPAVVNVAQAATARLAAAKTRLVQHGVSDVRAAEAEHALRTHGRLTLNFHPDRRDSMGRTVAEGLLADGRYRSQFETGISNGGRFAVPGGDRERWESLLFGTVYETGSLSRPIYGAFDIFNDPYGGAPRFGSCFVVLKQHCLDRATLCVGDSHVGPADVGTSRVITSILAGAVEDCLLGQGFGRDLSVEAFLEGLAATATAAPSARELDRYIEAQVHGGIDLDTDVEMIVLDPSFRHSGVQRDIEEAARRFGFGVTWNDGSELDPDSIDPAFRGRDMQDLARRAARPDGLVDAASIGNVLDGVAFTPPSAMGDPEESPRQKYKKLWHCCLHFGEPPAGHQQ